MITVAEISLSLLGTYQRTCGLVGADVVKFFDNSVKITWNGEIEKMQYCTRMKGVMVICVC